jgi:uncharacterized protein YbbC (DUF1343 family)
MTKRAECCNPSDKIARVSRLCTPQKLNIFSRMCKVLCLIGLASLFVAEQHADSRSYQERKRVVLGNERALDILPKKTEGQRFGLVINHTSLLPDKTPLIIAFLDRGIDVQAIFSPEHGYTGSQEGGSEVEDSRFANIPVFSLYGKTKKPTPDQMETIDALVYDIQDVGTRFYTYITTLKYVLEAAAEARKPVYILDRPNPAGGILVEGPILKEAFTSFIGACPIPIRYGLTPGELALMMRGEKWIPQDVDIDVIKMENWRRFYYWEDTGLPWIPTSPNIPTAETAIAYPGTGLLGALFLNQGLGTPHPFLLIGTPWLDPDALMRTLGTEHSAGIELEALTYTPISIPGKVLHPAYENRLCKGIRIRILEPNKFRSVHFTLALIKALKEKYGTDITVKFDSLNLLFGDDLLVRYLEEGIRYDQMIVKIQEEERSFCEKRHKYLLYE